MSSTMSWVGRLLKDSEIFILFADNNQILLKISVIPILLTFVYLVFSTWFVSKQPTQLIIAAHNCHINFHLKRPLYRIIFQQKRGRLSKHGKRVQNVYIFLPPLSNDVPLLGWLMEKLCMSYVFLLLDPFHWAISGPFQGPIQQKTLFISATKGIILHQTCLNNECRFLPRIIVSILKGF